MSEPTAEMTPAQLHARILEWEDSYDRLAGAFDLHMDILECKQALSDYAGVFYDVVLGEAHAESARLRSGLRDLKDRVETIRADYPSDVFPGDVGKGARMAIDRVLLLFALEARRAAAHTDDPPF